MPKLKPVPFATTVGSDGIIQNSNEVMVNMYSDITSSGRAQLVRRQRACLNQLYATTDEKRCIEKFNSLHYLIMGSGFYTFDGTTLTLLDTMPTSTGRCTMIFNDNGEIMISDGVNLRRWDGVSLHHVGGAGLTIVPGILAYLNGYGIVNQRGTDQFYITAPDDFTTIDALDFATAESSPDPLQTVFADHSDLFLIGTTTIEVWQDTGGVDFPFQAVTTAKIERGTPSGLTFAAEDNSITFLGDDLIVYRLDAYRPTRISTHAVEEALRLCSAGAIANAYAFIYTMTGHKFYTLVVPGELTVQYNFATGLWNEASTYGSDSWNLMGSAGHRSDFYLTAGGICSLSPDINTDEGGTVVRLARSAPGYADGYNIVMTEMFADVMVGRVAIDSVAEVMLRVALDAETFGNYRVRSLGAIGEYTTRPMWRGLGMGRRPVLELSASGDFNFAIMNVELNAQVANS